MLYRLLPPGTPCSKLVVYTGCTFTCVSRQLVSTKYYIGCTVSLQGFRKHDKSTFPTAMDTGFFDWGRGGGGS